jgi:hypothetical protein
MATDQQGAFQLRGLAPGSYSIASQATVEGGRYSGKVQVQVGSGDISGLEIRPMPPIDVNGSMRLEGSAVLRASQIRVMLQGQTPGIGSGGASAAAKDDGTFVLKNVDAGAYKVTVSPLMVASGQTAARLFVKSVRCGNAEVSETGVDFSNGGACDLSIVLSSNGGEISGTIEQMGEAPSMPMVVLLPAGSRRDSSLIQMTSAGSSGSFKFTGIAPGAYRVYAWDSMGVDLSAVEYDPDFVKPYESQSASVEISENSHESVTLSVIKIAKEQ